MENQTYASIHRLDTCWELRLPDGRTLTAKSKGLLVRYCKNNNVGKVYFFDNRTRKASTVFDPFDYKHN